MEEEFGISVPAAVHQSHLGLRMDCTSLGCQTSEQVDHSLDSDLVVHLPPCEDTFPDHLGRIADLAAPSLRVAFGRSQEAPWIAAELERPGSVEMLQLGYHHWYWVFSMSLPGRRTLHGEQYR